MGVKLKALIESTNLPLSGLKGKIIAVDGMNMLFQLLYNPAQRQKSLENVFYLDSTKRVITHLYGWLQKSIQFYKSNIFPIVVFDGKPDPYKRLITKNFAHDFIAAQKHYQEAMKIKDFQQAKFFSLGKSYMFINCIHESKRLLTACGIPVIMAPTEAEAQCVALQKQGIVDYVLSMDYDVVLFGAQRTIRKITFQSRKQIKGKWTTYKPKLNVIDGQANLSRLQLTLPQLIDLSILIGNDYFKGIENIGPKTAIESIKTYGSLEPMLKKHPNLFKNLPLSKIKKIRQLFLAPEVITIENINQPTLNLSGLRELLLKEHTLNKEKVSKTLIRLEKAYNSFQKKKPNTKKQKTASSMQPATSISEKIPINYSHKDSITINPIKNQFDIHLTRRLARAKTKTNTPITPPLQFVAASELPEDSEKYQHRTIKKKKTSKHAMKQKSSRPKRKLILKG
jgi:flap endonuclease-1